MSKATKYSFDRYVHLGRWVSYWHQIKSALSPEPKSVLVIGKGDEVVIDVIKSYVSNVKTLDFDESLKPDIAATVESMPIEDNSFELVLCAQVLEHLPFEKFEKCLSEIKRVSKRDIVLSLPHFGPSVKASLKVPFMKEKNIAFKIPYRMEHKFNGKHYWEIGKKNYPLSRIKRTIRKYFEIKDHFVPYENDYHHFFILENHSSSLSLRRGKGAP